MVDKGEKVRRQRQQQLMGNLGEKVRRTLPRVLAAEPASEGALVNSGEQFNSYESCRSKRSEQLTVNNRQRGTANVTT